ncbi:MAG: putative porin [Sandaracinaceae bacterium]|nr:putative porin [Sandaracinaceae bacterium]
MLSTRRNPSRALAVALPALVAMSACVVAPARAQDALTPQPIAPAPGGTPIAPAPGGTPIAPPASSAAEGLVAAPAEPAGAPSEPATTPAPEPPRIPLRVTASVTLRYDSFILGDPLDFVGGPDYVGGFRTRVRLGAVYDPADSPVHGGVRLVVGENPNPAASFVPIGDVARTTGIGLDQYYVSVRPLRDRQRVTLTAGKMPNPFFTGWTDVGFRSEVVFDQDIMPSGLALSARLVDREGLRLTSTSGYFVVQDIENVRFSGKTGTIALTTSQLLLELPFVAAAASYYRYSNLNAGLHAPGVVPGDGADFMPGTNAFLLRGGGLQSTNNRVNYGPNADGFIDDDWDVVHLLAQLQLDFEGRPLVGPMRFYAMLEYVRNLTTEREHTAVSATMGARLGAFRAGTMPPLDVWATYRRVQADATLAMFADADLGGGTDYHGVELGVAMYAHEQVRLLASYFDFRRAPGMVERVQRVFFDLIWSY